MVISFISGLCGVVLPHIFKYLQKQQEERKLKIENDQEYRMFLAQVEASKNIAESQLKETIVENEAKQMVSLYEHSFEPSNIKWVDAFCSIVRPISLIFSLGTMTFCAIKGIVLPDALEQVCVLIASFYFGHRTMLYVNNNKEIRGKM